MNRLSSINETKIVKPAAFRVSFFEPFLGAYNILDFVMIKMEINMKMAAVGGPTAWRDYLWVLSRNEKISQIEYNSLLGRLKEKNVPGISKLQLNKNITFY